jgi:GT2 family glycosyltransferase
MINFTENQHQVETTLLSICVVTYRPELAVLGATLKSLRVAIAHLDGVDATITIVDNSPDNSLSGWLIDNFDDLSPRLLNGHGNVGFARANNMAMDDVGDLHLILNPDVVLSPDCLANAVQFLKQHSECGLLTPLAIGTDGARQYLCKRYPALFDLTLRGFGPKWLRQLFKKRLDYYQMADMPYNGTFWDPPIISGCFMLFRGGIFRKLAGFDPHYFLYFEDFDLSLRARDITRIAFLPTAKIVHGGGDAARKGFWHIKQFICSAYVFYRKFGLKLL